MKPWKAQETKERTSTKTEPSQWLQAHFISWGSGGVTDGQKVPSSSTPRQLIHIRSGQFRLRALPCIAWGVRRNDPPCSNLRAETIANYLSERPLWTTAFGGGRPGTRSWKIEHRNWTDHAIKTKYKALLVRFEWKKNGLQCRKASRPERSGTAIRGIPHASKKWQIMK